MSHPDCLIKCQRVQDVTDLLLKPATLLVKFRESEVGTYPTNP